jgi:hypothetical protein
MVACSSSKGKIFPRTCGGTYGLMGVIVSTQSNGPYLQKQF